MSSPNKKRDVVRLRTFADDASKMREETGVSEKVLAEALPSEAPEEKGVFHKVKKKDLELEDTSNKGTKLDAEGIKFSEEAEEQVDEQAYYAQKSVTEDNVRSSLLEAVSSKPDAISSMPAEPAAVEQVSVEPLSPGQVAKAPKAGTVIMPPKHKVAATEPLPQSAVTAPTLESEAAETYDQINPPPPNNLGESGAQVVNDEGISSGEIVSDKKRERFKLIPAIGEAFTDWFKDAKDQIEEVQREKHTVGKIESRVDTIKAAAQQRTLAPDEDFSEVAKRLSNVKRAEVTAVPVLVKPKSTAEARWTHTTDSGNETQNQTTHQTSEAVAVPVPASPETSPAPAPEPIAYEPLRPEPVPGPITSNATAADYQPGDLVAAANAEVAKQQQTKPPAGFRVAPANLPSVGVGITREYLPSPMLAFAVVIVAIIAGIGTSLYFFWQPGEQDVIAEPTTKPLFTAQQQTNIPLSTHSETMSTLLAAINSNSNTVYMYLTRPETNELVSPGEIMSFLAPQVPGSFARSVTNISFGADQNKPFLVLRVSDFDSAFSGMLSWEQTMSVDLSPMFGSAVLETFDPQARTDTQTRSAFFKDVIASNLSSRLLSDEHGDDRIIYAFVDKQTIVITTDRLQLTNILQLIR